MNKFILIAFLLTVFVACNNAIVSPFACYWTAQGGGGTVAAGTAIAGGINCATACYRLTADVQIGETSPFPAGSINSVILAAPANGANGVQGLTLANPALPNPLHAPVAGAGVGLAGLVQLQFNLANMPNFIATDRGCLPILSLSSVPTEQGVTTNIPAAGNPFRGGYAGGFAGTSNTATGNTGATTGSIAVKQAIASGLNTGGVPLQLAYNPTIVEGANARPFLKPAPNTDINANLIANALVNQAAQDLAAVVTLFCVTKGVCCTSALCNGDPVVTVKSSANEFKTNMILITLSIIFFTLSIF